MIPHSFDSFLNFERALSCFAGAGLSWGLVPMPDDLLEKNREEVESYLGVQIEDNEPEAMDLYQWADKILDELANKGEPLPKLKLAKALGLHSNPVWAATVGYPVKGVSARHRVMARFVREDLWHNMWTWNWDCVLEQALVSIGFNRGAALREQPWLTRFDSVITRSDFPKMGQRHLFCILKPHGCAKAILDADNENGAGNLENAQDLSDRFMIGEEELANMRDSDADMLFFQQMRADLSANSAMILGWRIYEPYLLAVINETLHRVGQPGQVEELNIVDIHFNDEGHQSAADCYGVTQEQVFFDVSGAGVFASTDAFFLWLQAKFCTVKMIEASTTEFLKTSVFELAQIENPDESEKAIHWADCFIPAWCRACWRSGTVQCTGFDVHQLSMEAAEEHIPLNLGPIPRPDLEAAARLFVDYAQVDGWDLTTFPGAFWNQDELQLVIPIPIWAEFNELASLKPWFKENSLGMVRSLVILPIHFDHVTQPLDEVDKKRLQLKVANTVDVPQFADPANIEVRVNL